MYLLQAKYTHHGDSTMIVILSTVSIIIGAPIETWFLIQFRTYLALMSPLEEGVLAQEEPPTCSNICFS